MKKKIGLGAAGLLVLALLVVGHGGCASAKCKEGAASRPGAWQFDSDGVCLQGFEWKPAGEIKGLMVIVHGIRDHATRYSPLAEALTAKGFAVYAHDHRGHGHSGGHSQRFDSMAQLKADVDLVVNEARKRNPGKPLFLYGHSLGGLISTHYALDRQKDLAGLVLSGAALKFPPYLKDGEKTAARVFGTILPNLPAQPIDDSEFVSTEAARAEFMKDPLIDHANLPARSARTGVDAIEEVQKRFEELSLPMYVMHGGDDKATNIEGSKELHARAKSTDKTLALYDKQFHDLLHEPEAARIIADVTGWVEARATPAAPPAAPTATP